MGEEQKQTSPDGIIWAIETHEDQDLYHQAEHKMKSELRLSSLNTSEPTQWDNGCQFLLSLPRQQAH